LLAAAASLAESAPPAVAATFAETRLATPCGATYGTSRLDPAAIELLLERALPPL
jgi:putative acyl-CoA dehydrogenase